MKIDNYAFGYQYSETLRKYMYASDKVLEAANPTATRAMPVAAAIVLVMQAAAALIAAPVMVHTNSSQ